MIRHLTFNTRSSEAQRSSDLCSVPQLASDRAETQILSEKTLSRLPASLFAQTEGSGSWGKSDPSQEVLLTLSLATLWLGNLLWAQVISSQLTCIKWTWGTPWKCSSPGPTPTGSHWVSLAGKECILIYTLNMCPSDSKVGLGRKPPSASQK